MAFAINDETLRDGLQSPSATAPGLEAQQQALRCMARLGVDAASLGLPASSRAQAETVRRLLQTVVEEKLALVPHCAARTMVEDLLPIVELQQRVGVSLGAYAFLGTSPIRQFAEGWDLVRLRELLKSALRFAERNQLDLAFVTEDTLRTRPDTLRELFGYASDHGVTRFVLCDTVGHARPSGVRRLIRFVRRAYPHVQLDWHGHNDRGLAVANAITAIEMGVDRVHGTLHGIGERTGNTPLERLLAHRGLLCEAELVEYSAVMARSLGLEPPSSMSVAA